MQSAYAAGSPAGEQVRGRDVDVVEAHVAGGGGAHAHGGRGPDRDAGRACGLDEEQRRARSVAAGGDEQQLGVARRGAPAP